MHLYLTIGLFLTSAQTFMQEPFNVQYSMGTTSRAFCVDTVPSQRVKRNGNSDKYVFKDTIDWSNVAKAKISRHDSTLWIRGDIRKDYRIIGYEKPTAKSRTLILFSVFTREVKDNPLNCPFGSYYSTSDMTFEDTKFKFVRFHGDFAKVKLISEGIHLATFYFPKKWLEFSD